MTEILERNASERREQANVQGEYDELTAARRIAVNVAADRDRVAARGTEE